MSAEIKQKKARKQTKYADGMKDDEIVKKGKPTKTGKDHPDHMDTAAWWKRKAGVGSKAGEGALAKRRKEKLDKEIKDAGG